MKNKKISYYILGFLAISAILVWLAVYQNRVSDKNLKIIYCDVGQGDAILIKAPGEEEVLVDGGPDSSVLSCLGENMPFYDRKIGSIVLTHPHLDHIAGLIEVLKRYEVDEFWLTGIEYKSDEYKILLDLIKQKSIPIKYAQRGSYVRKQDDLKIKILYPVENLKGREIDNLNNSSIVSEVRYFEFKTLLMGDLEISEQNKLIGLISHVQILKVSHHGSANAFLTEFLSQLKPEKAVISVGEKNRYGHPTQKTIDLLGRFSVKIFRTDKNGTIIISSDGEKYWYKTNKGL